MSSHAFPTVRRTLAAGLAPALTALTALTALAGCGGSEGGGRFLSIGTGGTGGIYYPLGGGLAAGLSAVDPDRRYTAEVTGGSVENVNRVAAGQIDLGFALAVTAYEAFHGGTDFDTAVTSLRVVAPLYPNMVHILVPGRSSARSLADLRGARISVGSPGSGTEQVARQLLAAYGLDYGDVEERFLTFSESAASLRDGGLDAAILSVGYPAGAVLEATTTGNARLLPIEEEAVIRLRERHPYYRPGTIPADAYPGMDGPLSTAAMMNWLVARDDLEDDVVRAVMNIMGGERVKLVRVHEMARQINMEALGDPPIPLHPAVSPPGAGPPPDDPDHR